MAEEIFKGNIYFGKSGNNSPRVKKFLTDVQKEGSGLTPETLWMASEVGTTDSAKKHTNKVIRGQSLFDTPKPEELIARILSIASNPGDIVLDPFLGSGTTSAVAHKMGRRWIGIEVGDHMFSCCVPRILTVIKGEDSGGITELCRWGGGGGFRFLRLSP